MSQIASSDSVSSVMPPKSIAAKTMAVYRSETADALVLVTLLAPWERLSSIRSVSITFHVPENYVAEVVTMEPIQVLCANHAVRAEARDATNGRLGSRVLVEIDADGDPFPIGLRYTSEFGTTAATVGDTSSPLVIEAFGRLCPR